MTNLNTITSSSLKELARHLASDIRSSGTSPLSVETVVVQSSGMSRWLNIELAQLNGICSGIEYKFPNAMLKDLFNRIIPEMPASTLLDPENMTWRIMGALPAFLEHPEFTPVKEYCRDPLDDRKLIQFSGKVADCFDQYSIYRPDTIISWDQGKGNGWQPLLWRAVTADCKSQHRVALLQAFRERLDKSLDVKSAGLPATIRLFGISYLPVFYLEMLSMISKFIRVNIYLLNPCGEYWGDIVSRKRLAAISLKNSMPLEEATEYYETGNPLLSSLGTMGQEFFNLLMDYGAGNESIDNPAGSPQNLSLLKMVQQDILNMFDRTAAESRTAVPEDDYSIQLHSCHSPLREMQVLYDNLLLAFEDDRGLEPRHIIVMMPDIDTYAPYIAAVFGTASSGRPEIPFYIADRKQCRENPYIDVFLKILKTSTGRFGVNQVLDLLESKAIMNNFDISTDNMNCMRDWLASTRVRWGLDAEHRESLGFPGYAEFSWQSALERMLLGYAMTPSENSLFSDILPFDGIEGGKAEALGKLADFFHKLKETAGQLSYSRSLSDWADLLTRVIDNFLNRDGQSSGELKPLFELIQGIRTQQQQSGFSGSISLDGLLTAVLPKLETPGASSGFMGGKVTFCAMLPMRSIPFRIVCLVGMNDAVFPRTGRQPGFSLLNGKRMRGDRSLREEDRYLFLEALISAEEKLIITYTGQSNRDNSELPPSVVVSELIDYIGSGFASQASSTCITERTLVKHRLQSFSPAYFSSNQSMPWFSYSEAERSALESSYRSDLKVPPFCSPHLFNTDTEITEIQLTNLIRFYSNPAAYFLATRFNIRPAKPEASIEEKEDFTLNTLDNYNIKSQLVDLSLEGCRPADFYAAAKAASYLPPLATGRFAYQSAAAEAASFAEKVSTHLDEAVDPLPIDLQVGGYRLTGKIGGIRKNALLRYRCANMKGKDRLTAWIEHLVLNIAGTPEYPHQTVLICRDKSIYLPKMEKPAEVLAELLALYSKGHCQPLPFFPESSFMIQSKGIKDAEKTWLGNPFSTVGGESENAAYSICFGQQSPLDSAFCELAAAVYGPLITVSEERE
jgi:exodeoxyribonuclease V gamma subunit